MKYNMKRLVQNMEVTIVSPKEAHKERFSYIGISKAEFKNTVIRYYYLNDFFRSPNLRVSDLALLEKGLSPRQLNSKGEFETMFTIHHIIPVNCGGKTITSNLVPLPRNFHNFIHKYVLDPQIQNLKPGTRVILKGTPDFTKITLEMMEDPVFQLSYQKFLIDEYGIYPNRIKKIHRSRYDRKMWYKKYFKDLLRD